MLTRKKEVVKNGCKYIPIVEIFDSGLLRQMALSEM